MLLAAMVLAAIPSTELRAQGLFAKAGEQAKQSLAAYVAIWDSFYGKFDELLVAEAVKEDGKLEFDEAKGIAHFPVRLKVNETAYAKWLSEAKALLEAAGVKERTSENKYRVIGDKYYYFGANTDSEIERAWNAGELEMPRTGIIVELVDDKGEMLQYAALPIGVFKCEDTHYDNATKLPLYALRRWSPNSKKSDEAAYVSLSFAGLTRKSLLAVSDIKCRILVDPEFTKECRRLALAKIESDNKVFSEHGIETKVIMLPGNVPLAVNKTPKGFWFSRYEVTQDQWEAVMGNKSPSVLQRKESTQYSTMEYHMKEVGEARYHQIDSPDMPVDYLKWAEAVAFVKKLNALPAVKESGLVFSMPKGFFVHGSYWNEADSHMNHGNPHWEFACVGSSKLPLTAKALFAAGIDYGLDLDGNKMELEETAWCGAKAVADRMKLGNWYEKNHPVGMKRPNGFGLYDMIGNVGEMVDEYGGVMDSFRTEKAGFGYENTKFGFRKNNAFVMDSGNDEGRGFRLEAIEHGGSDSSKSNASSAGDAGDIALSVLLSETGFKFKERDGGKGYRATFNVGDGRSQMVLIDEPAEKVESISAREIWSVAAKTAKRPVNEEQMAKLLENSGGKFLGHWCLANPSDEGQKWLLYYSVKMQTSSTSDDLKATIVECAQVADHWEKKLFESDDN